MRGNLDNESRLPLRLEQVSQPLHHDIVQYVTVSLPTASLQDATAKLHSYGVQLARIRLVQPTPGSGKGSLTPG